jgi:hypothetical protein
MNIPTAQVRAVAAGNSPKSYADALRDLRAPSSPSELGKGKTCWVTEGAPSSRHVAGVVIEPPRHNTDRVTVAWSDGGKIKSNTYSWFAVRVRRQRP